MPRPRKKAPVVKNYVPDGQDELTSRIAECEEVVEHIENCPAWRVIIKDLTERKQYLDDNWQNLIDGSDALKEARIEKYAIAHIFQLKEKYKQDLEEARKALDSMQSRATKIEKDYDLETNLDIPGRDG